MRNKRYYNYLTSTNNNKNENRNKDITILGEVNSRYSLYFDSRYFKIYYDDIQIEFRDLNKEELDSELSKIKENESYKPTIINDIKIELPKAKAYEYIRRR